MAKEIIALDSKYFPMNTMFRRKAIRAVVTGRAFILNIKTYEKSTDVSTTFQFIIYPYSTAVRHSNRDKKYSKSVLNRDKHICAYCGRKADTVDHIVPRAKGGTGKWDNVIASCWNCNQLKGNRTPEEANMILLFKPKSRVQILFEDFEKKLNETL